MGEGCRRRSVRTDLVCCSAERPVSEEAGRFVVSGVCGLCFWVAGRRRATRTQEKRLVGRWGSACFRGWSGWVVEVFLSWCRCRLWRARVLVGCGRAGVGRAGCRLRQPRAPAERRSGPPRRRRATSAERRRSREAGRRRAKRRRHRRPNACAPPTAAPAPGRARTARGARNHRGAHRSAGTG